MTVRITFGDLNFYSTLGEHPTIILTNTPPKMYSSQFGELVIQYWVLKGWKANYCTYIPVIKLVCFLCTDQSQ